MVTMTQVKNGLMRYIDNEILPKMTGVKRFGLGIYSALAAENLEKTLLQYRSHPAVTMLDVFDEAGNVNIERIYAAAGKYLQTGEKLPLELPLLGTLMLDRNDLDRLYQFIIN